MGWIWIKKINFWTQFPNFWILRTDISTACGCLLIQLCAITIIQFLCDQIWFCVCNPWHRSAIATANRGEKNTTQQNIQLDTHSNYLELVFCANKVITRDRKTFHIHMFLCKLEHLVQLFLRHLSKWWVCWRSKFYHFFLLVQQCEQWNIN